MTNLAQGKLAFGRELSVSVRGSELLNQDCLSWHRLTLLRPSILHLGNSHAFEFLWSCFLIALGVGGNQNLVEC